MTSLGLEHEVIDRDTYHRTVDWFGKTGILLPTFAQLAAPGSLPAGIRHHVESVGPDTANPWNLFRVHWCNDRDRVGQAAVPVHVVLPAELTGVDAKIVVALGDLFPMIRAHKVLAAYACLVPRVITGTFDPARDRAVWPSTGNYCRGGVAISRLMGCRGVAVLPAGMSRERFAWLEDWVAGPEDIIRTPGTESNVKEIYDKCGELVEDDVAGVGGQFGALVVDLLDVALGARRADDVLGAGDPVLEPGEPLPAHPRGQDGHAAAAHQGGDRDPAAAVVPGRGPDGPVPGRIEHAGDDAGHQAPVGGEHLVRPDHREQVAEDHDDARGHAGELTGQDHVHRRAGQADAIAVVVPVHPEQVPRVRFVRLHP